MSILITGLAGQDGGYLAEQLVTTGHAVTGLVHPRETVPEHISVLQGHGKLNLIPCDLSDPPEIRHVLRQVAPAAIYHLAARSEPQLCEAEPEASRQINVVSCHVLVEWLRRENPEGRLLLLSSAAIFGDQALAPQDEGTPPAPQSEYGRQKLEVRELAAASRADGLFVACAIPFNHESERRSEYFVFAKVCNTAARIALGQAAELRLGALTPRRDWGYAPEYVQAMSWMLEVEAPLDLVLGTGESHTIQELALEACRVAGIDPQQCVRSDSDVASQHPPGILDSRAGTERAWKELGWTAQTKFAALVERLTTSALTRFRTA